MKKLLIVLVIFSVLFSANMAMANEKMWNIKSNPVSLIIGAYNAEVIYVIDKKITVGFGLLSWNTDILDIEFKASEYHGRFDYWFEGALNKGWYVGAQVSRLGMKLSTKSNGVEYNGDIQSVGYLAQGGYHWQWDNFNIDLGSYIGYYDFDSDIELTDASGNVEKEKVPAFGSIGAEFFVGWAF